MKAPVLTSYEAAALVTLAVFGFLVPNGVFVYFAMTQPGLVRAALGNPLSLVFIFEAFFLMFLFAWLIRRTGVRKPSALGFIVMSIVGSLAFSVPATLPFILKNRTPPESP